MLSGGRDRKDIPDDLCSNVKATAIKFWSVEQRDNVEPNHVEPNGGLTG